MSDVQLDRAGGAGQMASDASGISWPQPPEAFAPTLERDFSAKVLETIGCLVLVLEPRGRIVGFNPACERLTGLSAIDVCGRNLWELSSLHKADADGIAAVFQQGERSLVEVPAIPDFELIAQDGTGRHIAWNTTVMCDETKQITHIVHAGLDITENRLSKADSDKARSAAEAANRAKSDFLANMSHEIRTPMTAILGHIDLLDESGLSDGADGLSLHERRKSLRTIRRNAEHLLQLINDILDLSKIEAGKLAAENIPCCPLQIISDVAAVMRVRAIEKRIAFQVQYIGPIPQAINSDPTRLRQILINLVSNALKFTHSGSVRLLVRLLNHNSLDKPQLQFQVVDTGIGMTQGQIKALFRPFTQADTSTTRKFGGTGLGLSICKRLAEAMGGGISVESISGAGTTFTVWINPGLLAGVPLVLDPSEGDSAFPSHAKLPRELKIEQSLAGTRILLAEDGPDNQYLISLLLRRAGAKVTTVDNGRSAIAVVLDASRENDPFDLILMDMQMPEMDGYAATRRLRERGCTGKIIALTAHTMPGDREKCLAEGCDDYIPKPFEPACLIEAVARAVRVEEEKPVETPVGAFDSGAKEPSIEQKALLHDSEFAKLREKYLDLLEERAADLEGAFNAADLLTISEHATELKGSAGGFGFSAISQAAALVERGANAGLTLVRLSRAVGELVSLCKEARTPRTDPLFG